VVLALKRLEAVNLLRVERRRRGRGNGNIYVLNWAKPRKCKPLKNLQSKVFRDNTNLPDGASRPASPAAVAMEEASSLRDNTSLPATEADLATPADSRDPTDGSTARDCVPGAFPGIDSRPKTPEERAAVLRSLDDGIKLVKGSRFYRWVCEQFRLICFHGGASRGESDLICDAIGWLIDGRSLGFARQLALWLMEHIGELLRELRRAIVAGIRAAYKAVNSLILRAMGLLKFTLHCLKPKPQALAHRWAYNLNDRRERKEFLRRAREIAEAGGGPCPRCGQRIERRLLDIDSGIAFEEPGLCRCIYIALDRQAAAREERLMGQRA
jgi:hypothetical protein